MATPMNPASPAAPSELSLRSKAHCKFLSPPSAAENRNPNVNQGSCKRKVRSFPKASCKDQEDSPAKELGRQASADFDLISPPRKHVCNSERCAASTNQEYAAPAGMIPKEILGSNRCDQTSPEALETRQRDSLQMNKGGNGAQNSETGSCNFISGIDSQVRRWSSDDKDCVSLAGAGQSSPFLLPLQPNDREGINATDSPGQSDVCTETFMNNAHCLDPPLGSTHHESSNDLANFEASYGEMQSLAAGASELINQSDDRHLDWSTGLEGRSSEMNEDREGIAASPSPEKTGNWRLNAVLEAFGNLSPTREGRVKTLVRAFESLLSVKDKGDHQPESQPRSFPLQFSYLSSTGSATSDGRWQEHASSTGDEVEKMALQQRWPQEGAEKDLANECHDHLQKRETQPIHNQRAHSTDGEGRGSRNNDAHYIEKGLKWQQICKDNVQKLSAEDGHERSSVFQQPANIRPGKQCTNHKLRANLHGHSLQRFSMDGHSSCAAASKHEFKTSHKPSLGSSFRMSSSRPPLAQKPQKQPTEEKPKLSRPQPFKLLTQERGYIKEKDFLARLTKLLDEEERLRIPLAQGLPWTTDEPEIPYKPPVKENTMPLDIHLHSENRAMERAEFDHVIAEKLLHIEERRMEDKRLRRMAEEEEIKRMRQEMVPKAQLMPYFDRPFRPRRSSKRPTIPKEPQFQLNHKQSKRQKCVTSSIG